MIPCYIGSTNSRVLEGEKDFFIFSFPELLLKRRRKRWGMGKQKIRRGKNKKKEEEKIS